MGTCHYIALIPLSDLLAPLGTAGLTPALLLLRVVVGLEVHLAATETSAEASPAAVQAAVQDGTAVVTKAAGTLEEAVEEAAAQSSVLAYGGMAHTSLASATFVLRRSYTANPTIPPSNTPASTSRSTTTSP